MYKFLVALLLTGYSFGSVAQNHTVRLSAEYNVPMGKMIWSYKSSPGAQLSYIKSSKINKRWSNAIGAGIGYTQFNPIADTLYYVVDKGGVTGVHLGRAVFSPFKILSLSAMTGFHRRLSKGSQLSLSVGLGYSYGKRDIHLEDDGGAEDGISELIGRGAVTPRLGMAFDLSKSISVEPFAVYNFLIELGSTDSSAMDYNPTTGSILFYCSLGLAFNFNF